MAQPLPLKFKPNIKNKNDVKSEKENPCRTTTKIFWWEIYKKGKTMEFILFYQANKLVDTGASVTILSTQSF